MTVCGGGNAAHVAVGMFSDQGADVNMYFSFEEEARKFREACEATAGVTVNAYNGTYKGVPKVFLMCCLYAIDEITVCVCV